MEELVKRKSEIEEEVNSLMEFLNSCGEGVGLKGRLVDNEGFPRSDIDVFEVRKARNRIAILNTDYTNIMKEIENKLFDIHKNEKISVPIKKRVNINEEDTLKYPFGYIDSLLPDSPADLCGIKEGDMLIKFGNIYTEKELETQEESKFLITQISELVSSNIDNCIQVTLLRNSNQSDTNTVNKNPSYLSYSSIDMTKFKIIQLSLTPRKWKGHGVLGCHIAYLHKESN
ncbi:p27 like 26S proteasomal subunit with a PDZ domain [Cryptosporidium xiaoi]|uniref:P27 like 26S proteasomal subunit with a PDZ domain n=1 Tax=Cryptosporidium xiaoi TaxID=659607 RepID=A0AAV9XYZ2_9CRYT